MIFTFPLGAGIALAIGAIILSINKRVSIVSMSSILLFFICTLIFRLNDLPLVLLAGLLAIIVYVRQSKTSSAFCTAKSSALEKKDVRERLWLLLRWRA